MEIWDSYIELIEPANLPITIKAGRQRIYFGNNRIFGPGQWGNTGSWIWDAARANVKVPVGYLSAFYGRSEIHDPDDFSLNHRHGYECLGFYGHIKMPDNLIFLEPFSMTKKKTTTIDTKVKMEYMETLIPIILGPGHILDI